MSRKTVIFLAVTAALVLLSASGWFFGPRQVGGAFSAAAGSVIVTALLMGPAFNRMAAGAKDAKEQARLAGGAGLLALLIGTVAFVAVLLLGAAA